MQVHDDNTLTIQVDKPEVEPEGVSAMAHEKLLIPMLSVHPWLMLGACSVIQWHLMSTAMPVGDSLSDCLAGDFPARRACCGLRPKNGDSGAVSSRYKELDKLLPALPALDKLSYCAAAHGGPVAWNHKSPISPLKTMCVPLWTDSLCMAALAGASAARRRPQQGGGQIRGRGAEAAHPARGRQGWQDDRAEGVTGAMKSAAYANAAVDAAQI